jgi:uncharacterized protein YkwD
MRVFFTMAAVALLPACGGGASGSSSGVAPIALPPPPSATENNTFGGLLNTSRRANGVASVGYDTRLGVAAQSHANDMAANGFFSHTGSNGSTVGSRATAAGYNWSAIGENIAKGHPDQQAVLNAWNASPGHRANNLNPVFEDFGLAKAGDPNSPYWVLVLGKEQ